jgi:hypothetical protein
MVDDIGVFRIQYSGQGVRWLKPRGLAFPLPLAKAQPCACSIAGARKYLNKGLGSKEESGGRADVYSQQAV